MTRCTRQIGHILFGIALLGSTAAARGAELVEPSAILSAFSQVCRSGASDSETLRRVAHAAGWSPKPARVVSTATGMRVAESMAPMFFQKGTLSLTLAGHERAGGEYVCSISTRVADAMTTPRLAAAISPALNVGEPEMKSNAVGSSAQWQVAPDLKIEAAVQKSGSLRVARLVARTGRQHLASR
jgi:hypothetical protein